MSTGLTQQMDITNLSQDTDNAGDHADAYMGALTDSAHAKLDDTLLLQEMMENHILNYGEVIQAAQAIHPRNPKVEDAFTSWASLCDTIQALGYDPKGNTGWDTLGLYRNGDSWPSLDAIENRCQFLRLLLSGAEHRGWQDHEVREAIKLRTRIADVKRSCANDIASAPPSKSRYKNSQWGQWMEAGQDLIDYIKVSFPFTVVGLQLSHLESQDVSGMHVLEMDAARQLHDTIAKGTPAAMDQISQMGWDHVLLWAPHSQDTLNRVMGAFQKWATSCRSNKKITLFLPFDTPPSKDTFEGVADLCQHPLLGDKWGNIIEEKSILWEPGTYIFSGKFGPISAMKPFLCVTLASRPTGLGPQKLVHWKPSLASAEFGQAIVVDVPTVILLEIQQLLQNAHTRRPICWERPASSLASTQKARRSTIRGFLPKQGISDLDATLSCKEIRTMISRSDCTVGLRDSYFDRTSLIAELTCWEAIHMVSAWCDDILPISPKLALIRTGVPAATWQGILTRLMKENPGECVLRIKWRPSYHGGRPWATPEATTEQLRAVRAQAAIKLQGRSPGIGRDLESTLTLQGNLGPEPVDVLVSLMQAVSAKMGANLARREEGEVLEAGDWCVLYHPGTIDPNGRVRVRLQNADDAKLLQEAIHAQPVVVGGENVAVQVSNPALLKLPANTHSHQRGGPHASVGPPPGL